MSAFLTVSSPEEKEYCRKLLPRVEWFKPADGSHKASLNELKYSYCWELWDYENDGDGDDDAKYDTGDEASKCVNCHPSDTDQGFTCDGCSTLFYCRDSCKNSQTPSSHKPTCVFLRLQEEVVCCAASSDVFESSLGVGSCDRHDVSALAIRTLTEEARLYEIPWSLLLGCFHCVGGICRTWKESVPSEYVATFKTTENMMVEMLQMGYDMTEPVNVCCPGNWPQPELQCNYPIVCKQALARYASALEDAMSSVLLPLMSFQSTVGFDLLPIVFSYVGLAAGIPIAVGAPTWVCVQDRFKRRRLA